VAQLSNDQEDEEGVLQEQEVMASPDIEPVEELEEDRESEEIEEREDEMNSKKINFAWRGRSKKGGSRRGSARKREKGQADRHPRSSSKRH